MRDIDLSAVLPVGATGVVGTLTVVNADSGGFVSMFPTGQYMPGTFPNTSTLNIPAAGDTVANQVMVITAITPDRHVSVFASPGADVIVDVTGYITSATSPSSERGLFVASGARTPILDKDLPAGATTVTPVVGKGGVPQGATAVVVNLTASSNQINAFLTAWSTDGVQPNTSNINPTPDGAPVGTQAVIPVGTDGMINLYTQTDMRVRIDVIGYYTSVLPVVTPPGEGDTLVWDQQQRLVEYSTTGGVDERYSYDTAGIRTAVTSADGSKHIYLGGVEFELDPAGNVTLVRREYTLGSTVVAVREITAGSNQVSWMAGTGQGSVTATITPTGQISRHYYTPYGVDRGSNTVTATDRGYIGQHADDNTGLNYLNNRYQDPATGIFISVDPLISQTGEPYLYGSGNPTTLSDPAGLCSGREGGSGGCAVDNDDHRYRMVNNWVDVSRGLEFGGKTSRAFGGWSNGERDAYGDLYLQADYLEKDHIAYQLAASGAPYWVVKAIYDNPDSYLEWTGGIGFNAYDYPTQSELASISGTLQEALLTIFTRTSITGKPASAASTVDDMFHYTKGEFVDSISTNGLRPGSYATPNGGLSPLQAQIDLALPPNTGLRDAVMRVDVAGLREAGYQIPAITRATGTVTGPGGRVYTMPGGGYEMQFPYAIPPEFIKVVTP